MKQPYNTALYMRLSRDDENYGDSVSIETQRTILQQFAKEQELHVVGEYIDAPVIIGLKQNPTQTGAALVLFSLFTGIFETFR